MPRLSTAPIASGPGRRDRSRPGPVILRSGRLDPAGAIRRGTAGRRFPLRRRAIQKRGVSTERYSLDACAILATGLGTRLVEARFAGSGSPFRADSGVGRRSHRTKALPLPLKWLPPIPDTITNRLVSCSGHGGIFPPCAVITVGSASILSPRFTGDGNWRNRVFGKFGLPFGIPPVGGRFSGFLDIFRIYALSGNDQSVPANRTLGPLPGILVLGLESSPARTDDRDHHNLNPGPDPRSVGPRGSLE